MDKYYVYRPLLTLIGFTEGTARRHGYNETLAYGLLTNGDVNLVSMTLDQIDQLQQEMLDHPKNKWNSSALGIYQIVRTTRRRIQEMLKISGTALFNEDMQDRMACFLLGQRGIDKWLAGRLNLATLITNLAMEWASFPTVDNKSYYPGQSCAVPAATVLAALNEVKKRHLEGQPKIEVPVEVKVPVPVEKPVVPDTLEKEVRSKTNILSWLTGIVGTLASFFVWLGGLEVQTLVIVLVGAVCTLGLLLFAGEWIIRRIKALREELET